MPVWITIRDKIGNMINGDLKAKVDRVWDAFWTGGIANPLSAIEQITYLLFIRRLDDLQTLKENKANTLKLPIENPIYSSNQGNLRWSTFKDFDSQRMFNVVKDEVFPFLKSYASQMDGDGTTYSEQLKDALFNIPTPALLSKVVELLAEIPMADRDTNGDLYEYLLSKLATAGVNGQFRTPRHIIELMVELVAPQPNDEICDPAVGSAGFLVAASEYIRKNHPQALTNETKRNHFHRSMFHGYDNDQTMVRIGAMNLLLHGIEQPDLVRQDSLAEPLPDARGLESDRFSLILANPPFSGSLDNETVSADLQRIVKTKKTELLFLAAILKLLKVGGRAAVIVPEGVLFGSSNANVTIRKNLVEEQKLECVIKLPVGVFKPYAGVSTSILIFTKTNSGGTNKVWFYNLESDGYSLDDKRVPVSENGIPALQRAWLNRHKKPVNPDRSGVEFEVSVEELRLRNYDLTISRYLEVVRETVQYRNPLDILADLDQVQAEIKSSQDALRGLL
jgi:type I restriction enzyme M protein